MDRPALFDLPEEDAPFDPDLLPVLRKAIEANRVDLYLRPIVTLPERKLRYCDAVARVRTDSGELVGEDRYRRVAELAGLLPRIDNVMLVKSVQLLRRLGPESKLKRVFCGLSAPSLLDSDFFPELVEFLEENSALGESLTFQLSQRAIADLGEGELTSLRTLGKLGFCFSLDRIAHLDLDYGALRDYFFRFIKIDAKTFLSTMDRARAPVGAADMASYLDRFDLKLIVDNVADETSIAALLDYGVELAEGDLFAVPMPVSAEMFRELDSADAA
jgi:cyclic-di-GMP phosphodiesterase TipF (flagellum assembly factor)